MNSQTLSPTSSKKNKPTGILPHPTPPSFIPAPSTRTKLSRTERPTLSRVIGSTTIEGCFVCCGVDNVKYYLDSAKRQLHNFYYRHPLEKIKCYCGNALTMTMSHSERNPVRLFLKCFKRWCDFFQQVDEPPKIKKTQLAQNREEKLGWKLLSNEVFAESSHERVCGRCGSL